MLSFLLACLPLISASFQLRSGALISTLHANQSSHRLSWRQQRQHLLLAATSQSESISDAVRILNEWDLFYSPDKGSSTSESAAEKLKPKLEAAVRFLSETAADQRAQDAAMGRCILGICAPSAGDGVAALKAWVNALDLPRGLLHGMDKDGEPLELDGAVYIKYNSGGVYTFGQIRLSGMGFDALWKPGDALLEPYDGVYRGVYFQVELDGEVYGPYLLPVEVFPLD